MESQLALKNSEFNVAAVEREPTERRPRFAGDTVKLMM